MIEVINGVKIDWSKFKTKAIGKKFKDAKQGFTDFVLKADETDFYLDSDYTGIRDRVVLRYKYDKNIKIEITPNNFKKRTYPALKNIINNINGDKFVRISKAETNKKGQDLYLELQEELFNTKFETKANYYNSFVNGRETTYKICYDNNFNYLSPYLGATTKMLIDFNCGHKPHWVIPANLKKGNKCPKCSNRCPIQAKEEFIKILTEEGYILLSEYINARIKVTLQCPSGHVFETRPKDFKRGTRCNQCNKSSGEQRISNILDKLKINYIYDTPLFGMKADKGFLKPDFYISDLNIILEVDGVQHRKEVAIWGGKEQLKKQQRYDRLKENYCKKFNIDIIRIADTDKDLEQKVINIIEEKQKQVQAFNEALEEARNNIEAETDYHDFKTFLYSFFE